MKNYLAFIKENWKYFIFKVVFLLFVIYNDWSNSGNEENATWLADHWLALVLGATFWFTYDFFFQSKSLESQKFGNQFGTFFTRNK